MGEGGTRPASTHSSFAFALESNTYQQFFAQIEPRILCVREVLRVQRVACAGQVVTMVVSPFKYTCFITQVTQVLQNTYDLQPRWALFVLRMDQLLVLEGGSLGGGPAGGGAPLGGTGGGGAAGGFPSNAAGMVPPCILYRGRVTWVLVKENGA